VPVSRSPDWARLERAADDALSALDGWRSRALEAEAELSRLREVLEGIASEPLPEEEARGLRAENAALRARMAEAHKRITRLVSRMSSLHTDG